ncbi:MAG: hypothetical protein HY855_10885 [Burkholderiales bacterium]|nr:hypothetical protein [Burkholderiales bacterium]
MQHLLKRLGALSAALLCTTAAWSATTSFSSSYSGSGSTSLCSTTYSIKGVEPADSAKHPVFLYMVGTTESYDNAQAMAAVNEMAAKGFVAAAVEYNSALFGSCSAIGAKAACIFKPSSTASAVSKLCSRARADCSKGIVVAGFSQGSVIATLAKNTDSRVRAAYGMGTHNLYTTYVMSSCMNAGKYTLPASNLRIVNGESDIFPGGTASTVRSSSQSVTGKSCGSGAYQCLNTNGSGWIMVKGSQVSDLSADHCYQRASGGCVGLESLVDSKWKSGTENWSLPANLNWLAGFATP